MKKRDMPPEMKRVVETFQSEGLDPAVVDVTGLYEAIESSRFFMLLIEEKKQALTNFRAAIEVWAAIVLDIPIIGLHFDDVPVPDNIRRLCHNIIEAKRGDPLAAQKGAVELAKALGKDIKEVPLDG